jgi:hypothetical protein
MGKFTLEFKEQIKTGSNRLANLIENPYRNFSSSKMSSAVKPMTIVQYKDLMGKVHSIKCANRTQMKEAQAFLSIFKTEAAKVKEILSEYPVSYGQIPKKFMKELRSDLGKLGFTTKFINRLAGY